MNRARSYVRASVRVSGLMGFPRGAFRETVCALYRVEIAWHVRYRCAHAQTPPRDMYSDDDGVEKAAAVASAAALVSPAPRCSRRSRTQFQDNITFSIMIMIRGTKYVCSAAFREKERNIETWRKERRRGKSAQRKRETLCARECAGQNPVPSPVSFSQQKRRRRGGYWLRGMCVYGVLYACVYRTTFHAHMCVTKRCVRTHTHGYTNTHTQTKRTHAYTRHDLVRPTV